MADIEACEQDVIGIISTLNVYKAVGHDIISNRMLLTVCLYADDNKCIYTHFFLISC
jgi:hypothetical protein